MKALRYSTRQHCWQRLMPASLHCRYQPRRGRCARCNLVGDDDARERPSLILNSLSAADYFTCIIAAAAGEGGGWLARQHSTRRAPPPARERPSTRAVRPQQVCAARARRPAPGSPLLPGTGPPATRRRGRRRHQAPPRGRAAPPASAAEPVGQAAAHRHGAQPHRAPVAAAAGPATTADSEERLDRQHACSFMVPCRAGEWP